MANWAYIENGQIVEKHDNLPVNWKNISNFFAFKDNLEHLKTLGWVPVTRKEYTYNKSTHKLTNPRLVLSGMTVTEEYDVVAIVTTQPKVSDIQNAFLMRVRDRLNNFAKTRMYDDILSACSYVNDSNLKFKSEAEYCIQMRSETYSKLFEILSDMESNKRPLITNFNAIESELPNLVWPE